MKPTTGLYAWWPLAAMLLAGICLRKAIWSGQLSFSGKPSVDGMATLIGTESLIFGWLILLAPLTKANRVKAVFLAFAMELVPDVAVCVTGFTGDGQPMFAWRWKTLLDSRIAFDPTHREQSSKDDSSQGPDLITRSPSDYPGFRGPDRLATIGSEGIDWDWSRKPPVKLWRQPVGRGWSSFAVVGQSCVTQEQLADRESVVCYDIATGRELWRHVDQVRFQEMMGGEGPRATPTIDNGRVYALGATGLLNSLDGSSGDVVWSVDILGDNHTHNAPFGMCGSPLVCGSMVVVSPGGTSAALVAYDRNTGQKIWAAGDSDTAYCSPQVASLGGHEQILSFNAEGLFAHDPASGRILWSYPWQTPPERNNVCQPIPLAAEDGQPDRMFISSGYGKGCALLGIDLVSDEFQVRQLWVSKHLKSKFASAVVHRGFVYGLDDGILTCIDLHTGDARWKQGRYGHGQLLLAGDMLLVQAEKGDIVLVAASAQRHEELGRIAALSERTWNHPALAGNLLVVRNDREAACYRLPAP